MESARESRRRRILERGSERLAFISGQARLVPDSSSSSPRDSHTSGEGSTIIPKDLGHGKSGQAGNANTRKDERDESTTFLAKLSRNKERARKGGHDETFMNDQKAQPKVGRSNGCQDCTVAPLTEVDATNYHISDKIGSNNDHNNASETFESIKDSARSNGHPAHESNAVLVSKTEHDIDTIEPGNNDQVKPLQTERDTKPPSTSMPESSSQQVVSTTRMHAKKQMPFSSKQVIRGISASETMRLVCAVIIALLVVMSRRGYTLASDVASSVLSFKPLFLAMITDVTIILWLLKTTQQKEEKEREKEKARTGRDESGSTDVIGDTVEAILVFLKVATAIFMDCSICAVIIVCGLCF
ncbi:hypothetical protein ZIOFF_075231 [Zingiber officinale]|uniref:Uncharacterized protein n=1 Tax=Zingiber officinale TaxID=94328 RepID=A0A8J5ERL6_ZINOF|nr:hypothetical protein ZIOFF_075231 [Zingiber officinale]